MKFLFSAIFLLLFVRFYGQEQIWNEYEIDSIVSIELPFEEVYELDTIIQDKSIFQLSHANELGTSFIAQRMRLEVEGTDPNLSTLPYDLASLDESYSEFIRGVAIQSGYDVLKQEKITIDDKIGYYIELGENNLKKYKSSILILDKYVYSFIIFNADGIQTKDSYFFDSVRLYSSANIIQFSGASQESRIASLLGKLSFYVVLIVFIIVFVNRYYWSKKKSNY